MNNKIIETITNEVPNIIILKDYAGNFLYANKTLANLYNTTPSEMIGKTDSDYNPNTEQTDFYLKNIKSIMDKGKTEVVLEESTNNATGEIHYYQSTKKPLIDEDGNKQILVIANEITDIQKAKIALEEKQSMLDNALEIIGEGVWEWNIKNNIVKHNKKWLEMFGVDDNHREHSLDFFSALLHKDDKQMVEEKIFNAIKNNTQYFSEHRLLCSNGDIKWVQDRGEIVKYDVGGEALIMVGSAKDITDTKRLEESEQLLEKQSRLAALGEMIGNISHQWKQPLSVINSLVTSLEVQKQMNKLDDATLAEKVNSVQSQIEYLSQTIDDFKNFIKNDRKNNFFEVKDMLRKTLSLVKAVTDSAYIKVIVGLNDNSSCSGYESEILQVFINIINNAKDAIKEKVKDTDKRLITIDSMKKNNMVSIHIKDSAGGIPENIIEQVFDPYFTTKNDNEGTGLGLHMSKKIVEENGGKISVINDIFTVDNEFYSGAHFKIDLPIYNA